jgi:ABC-2 type transport system ATP-binding protein
MLEALDLVKRYGPRTVVDGVSLRAERGEIVGLLGPNGAGKTTTIRMLLDFLRPTAGGARVLGGSGSDPGVRARIGYLPADLHVDPRWSADDLVHFYAGLRGALDTARYRELLERFDLDPARPTGELSTGNRRKVGIVQAFVHRPELLVLDEPTSGLDPLLQLEFQALARETSAEGATVFLSSHVLHEVEVLADRVGILRRGELVAVAGVDDLRDQARQRLDLYVAGPVDPRIFSELDEVQDVQATDGLIRLVVEGSLDRVVKAAARLEVHRIVTLDTDLEDVFLGYYRDQP